MSIYSTIVSCLTTGRICHHYRNKGTSTVIERKSVLSVYKIRDYVSFGFPFLLERKRCVEMNMILTNVQWNLNISAIIEARENQVQFLHVGSIIQQRRAR